MNNNATMTVLVLATMTLLAAAHAGLLGGPLVLQGPSSKTTLIGPDGSHITGVFPGGRVVVPGATTAGLLVGLGPSVIGSGHEGQYVHDYTEQLYDDGSYKGDYYEGH